MVYTHPVPMLPAYVCILFSHLTSASKTWIVTVMRPWGGGPQEVPGQHSVVMVIPPPEGLLEGCEPVVSSIPTRGR